jgi:AcrR family transcriptional regulator
MSEKLDRRRAAHLEALILAAEQRIAAEGINGLKARELAQDVGIALGAIYNLVPDLVELRFHVTRRTLQRLDAALSDVVKSAPDHQPIETLIAIAHGYLRFAEDNHNLWRGTFEYLGPESRPVPDWLLAEQIRLFQRVLAPLGELMPRATSEERQLFARTLFTAAHGIIDMGLQSRIFAVPAASLEGQLDFLLRAICEGLTGKP